MRGQTPDLSAWDLVRGQTPDGSAGDRTRLVGSRGNLPVPRVPPLIRLRGQGANAPQLGDAEHDLAELLAGLDLLVRPARLVSGKTVSTTGRARLARDELVDALESCACPWSSRRSELAPPDAVQVRRRVRPARRAADVIRPPGRASEERPLLGRLADVLDDDVGPPRAWRPSPRRPRRRDAWFDRRVRPEGAGALELLVASRT